MLTGEHRYGPGKANVDVPVGEGNHTSCMRFEFGGVVKPVVVFGDFTTEQRDLLIRAMDDVYATGVNYRANMEMSADAPPVPEGTVQG